MGDVVEFAIYKERRIPVVDVDKWTFAPKGRLAFLAKAAWWLLHKLHALQNTMSDKVSYKRVQLNKADVFDKILEMRFRLLEEGLRPSRIYIGAETLDELYASKQFRELSYAVQPMSFNVRAGHNRTLFNLPITIVPYMIGVIVLDERAERDDGR